MLRVKSSAYGVVMTQPPPWSARLVRLIAGEIKRWRDERGMSGQQLADACEALGHPVPRSVIANLESGRRETITVPELLVLAQALRVPPLRLLIPLGYADSVEVLPGTDVLTTDALRWLRGEAWINRPWEDGPDGDSAVASFITHRTNLDRYEWSRHYARQIRKGAKPGTEDDIEEYERRAENAAEGLKSLRHLMRVRGLTPPPLPVSLAYLDEEGPR